MENKTKLRKIGDLNIDVPGITDDSKNFLRPNLCPYYKKLAFNCRELKRRGLILKVITSDEGTLKIVDKMNKYIKISHELDLTQAFPNFAYFNFVQ